MITNFGKILRKIRIDRDETLYEMAKKLEMTSSYLSAIECNKRKIPEDFIEKLQEHYNFTDDEMLELKNAKDETINKISINMNDINLNKRTLALEFARSFNEIDDKKAEELIKQLRKLQRKD